MKKNCRNYLLFILLKSIMGSIEIETKFCIFRDNNYIAYFKLSFQDFNEENETVLIYLEILSLYLANAIKEKTKLVLKETIMQGRFAKGVFYKLFKFKSKTEQEHSSLITKIKYNSNEFNIFTNNNKNDNIELFVRNVFYGNPLAPKKFSFRVKFGKLEIERYESFRLIEYDSFIEYFKEVEMLFDNKIEELFWIIVTLATYILAILHYIFMIKKTF